MLVEESNFPSSDKKVGTYAVDENKILRLGGFQMFSEVEGKPLEGFHHTRDMICFVFLKSHSGKHHRAVR